MEPPAASEGRFEIGGRHLKCTWCDGVSFEMRRGVLDTRGMTFFGMSWANRGSTEYICRNCGFMITFADQN